MTDITLLDGAIGMELINRSGDRPTPLWSTQVMLDHPKLVEEVHAAYFAAGATVATTNTYAILEDRFAGTEIEGKVAPLTEAALAGARTARDAHGSGRIAGSIGPLLATYRPDLSLPPEQAVEMLAEPVGNLLGKVDLILLETLSSVEQAEGALRAACGNGLPVWLSVTVDDDDGAVLRSGEPVGDLAGIVEQYKPEAVLVNCSRPEAIGPALRIIKGFGRAYGGYGNGFTRISDGFLGAKPTVEALESRQDLSPAAYADFAMEWVEQGATIIGGCCEVGPEHIAELARRLRAAGHRIV